MPQPDEIEYLYDRLAYFERNSTRSSWLFRQLGRKIKYFPRDFSRRLRRSIKKRRLRNETAHQVDTTTPRKASRGDDFFMSAEMLSLVAKARSFDPEIGELTGDEPHLKPRANDAGYEKLREATKILPKSRYDSVVLMPAGRMGGADLVAAILVRALVKSKKVLILRTDDSHWDCPHWYPEDVDSIDISPYLKDIQNQHQGIPVRHRALYVILTEIAAPQIFNVNSRLAFETMVSYGAQLASQFKLYAYYFCADRTENGSETGYPVLFFHNIFRYLDAAILDTKYLANILENRFSLPLSETQRLKTIYTPAQVDAEQLPVSERHKSEPDRSRPRILWGGRLDRQKRFDLVVQIARGMPDVDFLCWGKAVLDKAPSMKKAPENLHLNPPFKDYDELPLGDCDGWLYTSEWDGLPTILIELGALGMPIAASAVGGVPELIDEETGWLVPETASVDEYVAQIRAMIDDPEARVSRGRALQQRVRERHSMQAFVDSIDSI